VSASAAAASGRGRFPGLTPDEAVELFLARARDADPAFAPSDAELPQVQELCARLEGMPLALELAAARVQTFSPAQMTARLDQSLDILSAGRRTALSRQQTLRAAISWSHDLLDGEERVFFRRLAVFAGLFSLDAATEVCAGGAVEKRDVVPLLLRLVDKSLVIVEDAALARYRLLDTVRQFADECLTAAGERVAVEARLRDWALAFATDPPPLARFELDHDNLRAALDSGLRGDPQGALRLAANVCQLRLDRNYFTEGSRRLRAVLDAAPEPTELRATTLLAAAGLELRRGRPASFIALGSEAATMARGMRAALAADVIHRMALLETAGGTLDAAERACDEALALAGEEPVRASILSVSSLVSNYLGQVDAARRRLEAALEELERVPARTPPFFEGFTFGYAVLPEGPDGRLRPFHEETLILFHRFDRARAIPHALCNLALLARAQGRRNEAEALHAEALAGFRCIDEPREEAHALAALGNSARSFGVGARARIRRRPGARRGDLRAHPSTLPRGRRRAGTRRCARHVGPRPRAGEERGAGRRARRRRCRGMGAPPRGSRARLGPLRRRRLPARGRPSRGGTRPARPRRACAPGLRRDLGGCSLPRASCG
jgi:tetratricopeptide (TPR) repeat protein